MCDYILNFISLYFLILELFEMIHKGRKYFLQYSKLVIFVSPALILYNTVYQDLNEPSFWQIQSWSALLLFLRFAMQLRVFKGIGWLVSLIIESIREMAFFFLVLMIGIFAFADAFLSIDRKLELQGLIPERDLTYHATNY